MIFGPTAKKKDMSAKELGAEIGGQQKTACPFKKKVRIVMKQNDKDKLRGKADPIGTLLGAYIKKHRGWSLKYKQIGLKTAE